jgi:hypothetical protein
MVAASLAMDDSFCRTRFIRPESGAAPGSKSMFFIEKPQAPEARSSSVYRTTGYKEIAAPLL